MLSTNLIDLAFFLKKTSLLNSLELDVLLSIADKMELHHFQTGDDIFLCNQESYRMYFIHAGSVVIKDGKKQELAQLISGDFFGEEAFFNEQKRSYSAHCKTKAELFSISRPHFMSILYEFPAVSITLLEAYTQHLTFRTSMTNMINAK